MPNDYYNGDKSSQQLGQTNHSNSFDGIDINTSSNNAQTVKPEDDNKKNNSYSLDGLKGMLKDFCNSEEEIKLPEPFQKLYDGTIGKVVNRQFFKTESSNKEIPKKDDNQEPNELKEPDFRPNPKYKH